MPRGRKPREYPEDIVKLACAMYEAGMTVAEIRAVFPKGYRVQTILERHLPQRRPMAKRDQTGEKNHMWRGDEAGYQAIHLRLVTMHGVASSYPCINCGDQAADWSYVGGCPNEKTNPESGCAYSSDPARYVPRCKSCHLAHDRTRDAAGRLTRRESADA